MKKILRMAMAVITVMAIVSCGASPQPARDGYKKAEAIADAATRENGRAPDFTYYTAPANSREDLVGPEGKINLMGFYGVDFSDNIKDFQIVVTVYKTGSGCDAELYVLDSATENYASVFSSTSCSHNSNGLMMMRFDGGTGSIISLTGSGSSQSVSFVTIEDSLFYPTKFTDQRKFYNAVTASPATR